MSAIQVSGLMFEPVQSGAWKSIHAKEGAHYNTYMCEDEDGMAALRKFFPGAKADDMNFVLFSTSGIHGMYTTIEKAECDFNRGCKDEDGEEITPHVTFLIVQPRIVCLRCGNCEPKSAEDFDFIKELRASSWAVIPTIGAP